MKRVTILEWRKIALYGTDMAMELCWLYSIVAIVNKQAAGEQLSVFDTLLTFPLAFGFNRFMQRLRWHKTLLTMINWLAWAVVMLILVKVQLFGSMAWLDTTWLLSLPLAVPQLIYSLKPELLLLITTAVIWWLGKWLAYRSANFTTSVAEFQFGLLILVITFVMASALQASLANSTTVTLSFFCFALVGISIAHRQPGKSWLNGITGFHWSWLLLVSIALILVLGLLISVVVSPDLLRLVVDALKWVGRMAMNLIAFIVSLFPRNEPSVIPPPDMGLPPMEPQEQVMLWNLPEHVRSWLQIFTGILWGGLIALALWRISSQIFGWLRKRFTADTEVEPLRGAFLADLVSLLNRLWHTLSGLPLLSFLLRRRRLLPPEAVSVRQIYRRLLHWGTAHGYPRHLAQTPNEYLDTLIGVLPQAQEDLLFITHHYVNMRYGNSRPTSVELQELRERWKKIKQYRFGKTTH